MCNLNEWQYTYNLNLGFYIYACFCGMMGSIGYIMMLKEDTPSKRLCFAKMYLIGGIVGVWIGFYMTFLIQILGNEYYEGYVYYNGALYDAGAIIGFAAVYPVMANIFCYYFYVCIKSYGEMGELAGFAGNMMGATTVVYQQQPQQVQYIQAQPGMQVQPGVQYV